MAYDGTTKLSIAIADVIGCSPKSNNKLSAIIGQAKNDLSISLTSKRLSPETNQKIYSYLVELYSHPKSTEQQTPENATIPPVEIISQPANDDPVNIFSQDNQPTTPESKTEQQAPVNIVSQVAGKEDVNIISQPANDNAVELYSQPTNNEPVEIFSQVDNFDNVRIAFYIKRKGKRERQVIALDGFFINALASIGISKQDAPQWVQAQVNDWTAFDAQLPVTRQVKYLIMVAVVKGLGGDDSVFYSLD